MEKKKNAAGQKKEGLDRDKHDSSTIKFVSMTEKSVKIIELENKLVFIVDRKSSKEEIKKAIKQTFDVDAEEIKTCIDQKGRKKAFVKFKDPGMAGEIAMRLGVI